MPGPPRAPKQVQAVEEAGVAATQFLNATYTEVRPRRRLALSHLTAFIPGVEPYQVAHLLEFHLSPRGVQMVLTFDAMHDEHWTQLATMGWNSEFDKLGALVVKRGS